jgi:hypothetical protein
MRCPDFHGRRFLARLMIVANPWVAGPLRTPALPVSIEKDWSVQLLEPDPRSVV